MTALLVVLGVIAAITAIIVILLHFSLKIYVSADKGSFSLEIKYLCFSLYKMKHPDDKGAENIEEQTDGESEEIELGEITEVASTEEHRKESTVPKKDSLESDTEKHKSDSSENQEKEAPPDDSASSDAEDGEKDEPKTSLIDQYNEYKKYIPAAKKAFRKLLKLIRFYDLEFSLTYGSDDAYETGLNFGRLNAVLYSLLGLLCCIFSVKIKSTEIKCDFNKKTFDFMFATAIYIRPSALIALALYIGVYYLKIRNSIKKLEKNTKEKESHE